MFSNIIILCIGSLFVSINAQTSVNVTSETMIGVAAPSARPPKPGVCPADTTPSGVATICLARCSGDESCPGKQKCCSVGCSTQCMQPLDACATMKCARCYRCLNGRCIRDPKQDGCRPRDLTTQAPQTLSCANTLCMVGLKCTMYENQPRCVKDEVCLLPQLVGRCKAAIRSYWYNALTDKCEIFSYGGCQGNANRFATFAECEKRCSISASITTPAPTISCANVLCKDNTYCTMSQGEPKCVPQCQLPLASGSSCNAALSRWYFDAKANDCKMFVYGGCEGNSNNFKTLAECRQMCVKEQVECPQPPIIPPAPKYCHYEPETNQQGCVVSWMMVCIDVDCPPPPPLAPPEDGCHYINDKDENGCETNWRITCESACNLVDCASCHTCIENSNHEARCVLSDNQSSCCNPAQGACFMDPCKLQATQCPQATYCKSDCACVPTYYDKLWNKLDTQTQCNSTVNAGLSAVADADVDFRL